MNINHLHGRPASSSSVRANGADKVKADEAARASGVAPVTDATDRVELSASARASDVNAAPEMAFARKALENIPPMSQERVAEILDRIKSDYYSQPEVARDIAQRVAANISTDLFED